MAGTVYVVVSWQRLSDQLMQSDEEHKNCWASISAGKIINMACSNV